MNFRVTKMTKKYGLNLEEPNEFEVLASYLIEKIDNQTQYKRNKLFIHRNNIYRTFYYFRDENNYPIVTICLLYFPKENILCRGLSICSPRDSVSKEEGRDISEDRAIKAFREEKNIDLIRRKSIIKLLKDIIDRNPKDCKVLDKSHLFKGQYNVAIEHPVEMKINNK